VSGECEIKNVQAMKVMDLFGAGGSFSEFYLADFVDDVVFLGHDGPAHFAIARAGSASSPCRVPREARQGPLDPDDREARTGDAPLRRPGGRCRVLLLTAEGDSVPGPVLQIGNTNSRYRFSVGAKAFMNDWSRAGPRTTAPSASATSPGRSRSSARSSASMCGRSADAGYPSSRRVEAPSLR